MEKDILSLLTPKDIERFLSKIDKTPGHGPQGDCWRYAGFPNPNGGHCLFEVVRNGRKEVRVPAHRLAWMLTLGDIPAGLHVLHRCDVPACVRPDHLFLGTNLDNIKDKVAKNRQARQPGESHPLAKLTEEDVTMIRSLYEAGGISQQALAGRYGVSRGTIASAIQRKSWRHL